MLIVFDSPYRRVLFAREKDSCREKGTTSRRVIDER
jgi:hypothetical protein